MADDTQNTDTPIMPHMAAAILRAYICWLRGYNGQFVHSKFMVLKALDAAVRSLEYAMDDHK